MRTSSWRGSGKAGILPAHARAVPADAEEPTMKKSVLLLLRVSLLLAGPWLAGCGQDDNRPDYYHRRPVYDDNNGSKQRQFEDDR